MIAEEYHYRHHPNSSIPKGTTISFLLTCIKHTSPFFKTVLTQPDIIKPLNENKLSQIFVEQLDFQLRKQEINIGVKNQYSDIFFGTKGIPDFYFHNLEEGRSSIPVFIVEAKRLPAPSAINETEYVKGQKYNGGIERFKNEKHGKGVEECGMLGFIEDQNAHFWLEKINSWIKDLSKTDNSWSEEEYLTGVEFEEIFTYLMSTVYTINKVNIKLHHTWVSLNSIPS